MNMKQIINGKSYNTETADFIAEWDNGYYGGDFHRCSENLYQTKKGQYFIHGNGGAMSSYAQSSGNMVVGGERIRLITKEEALKWCENHNCFNEAEEHFKDMIKEG